jgi:hypothetical protein
VSAQTNLSASGDFAGASLPPMLEARETLTVPP